jgi:hypothetical protein
MEVVVEIVLGLLTVARRGRGGRRRCALRLGLGDEEAVVHRLRVGGIRLLMLRVEAWRGELLGGRLLIIVRMPARVEVARAGVVRIAPAIVVWIVGRAAAIRRRRRTKGVGSRALRLALLLGPFRARGGTAAALGLFGIGLGPVG